MGFIDFLCLKDNGANFSISYYFNYGYRKFPFSPISIFTWFPYFINKNVNKDILIEDSAYTEVPSFIKISTSFLYEYVNLKQFEKLLSIYANIEYLKPTSTSNDIFTFNLKNSYYNIKKLYSPIYKIVIEQYIKESIKIHKNYPLSLISLIYHWYPISEY